MPKLGAIIASAFLGLLIAQPSSGADATPRPNVLVILADDLGYSDIGCYGGEIATPNLDSLAANGLRFSQFYNTARCWPTRGALLTGYYAQQIRRDALPELSGGGKGQRPAWAQLIPKHIKPLGYRSYVSGKWHVDGQPMAEGFDHAYTLNDHNRFFNPQNHTRDDQPLPPVAANSGHYSTTFIASHAIECLQEHAEKYSSQPFFHLVAFTSPHFPLHAPAEDIDKYKDRYHVGWDTIREQRWNRIQQLGLIKGELRALEPNIGPPYDFPADIKALGAGEVNRELAWKTLTTQQQSFQAAKMAVHAAMVDRMDQEIGRVVQQLKTMKAFENTLILFLSDNGSSAEIMVRGEGNDLSAPPGSAKTFLCLGPGWSSAGNTPFRRHKTWVHEGGISTPLVAHWPKGIAARGELRHDAGHVIDIAPTVVELAGGKWPSELNGVQVPPTPGRSLVGSFQRDGSLKRESLWWLHEGNRAIRQGNFKLVAAKNEPWQLYDLATDRAESHDLAAKMPERAQQLETAWNSLTSEFTELAKQTEQLQPAPKKKKNSKKDTSR